jgi:hypothetical protein
MACCKGDVHVKIRHLYYVGYFQIACILRNWGRLSLKDIKPGNN